MIRTLLLMLIFQLTTSHGGRHGKRALQIRFCSFNSRPHTEVDAEALQCSGQSGLSFNSRPHTEVDAHRFRPTLRDPSFNSRPHTEVDKNGTIERGRPETFNSRPHTEVDDDYIHPNNDGHLSTHDLTRRSTANIYNNLHIFNSIFLLI